MTIPPICVDIFLIIVTLSLFVTISTLFAAFVFNIGKSFPYRKSKLFDIFISAIFLLPLVYGTGVLSFSTIYTRHNDIATGRVASRLFILGICVINFAVNFFLEKKNIIRLGCIEQQWLSIHYFAYRNWILNMLFYPIIPVLPLCVIFLILIFAGKISS
jgi:hypothetical protein